MMLLKNAKPREYYCLINFQNGAAFFYRHELCPFIAYICVLLEFIDLIANIIDSDQTVGADHSLY
jgi:hypothetical protein